MYTVILHDYEILIFMLLTCWIMDVRERWSFVYSTHVYTHICTYIDCIYLVSMCIYSTEYTVYSLYSMCIYTVYIKYTYRLSHTHVYISINDTRCTEESLQDKCACACMCPTLCCGLIGGLGLGGGAADVGWLPVFVLLPFLLGWVWNNNTGLTPLQPEDKEGLQESVLTPIGKYESVLTPIALNTVYIPIILDSHISNDSISLNTLRPIR